MNYLFVLIFTALLFVVQTCGIKKFGGWFNPISFFCGLWSLTAAISNLGLYGYYTPSNEVNIVMLVGILVSFAACMGIDFKGVSFKQSRFSGAIVHRGYGLAVVCCVLAILLLLVKLPQAISIISNSGWAYLRLAYYANPSNYVGPQYMSTLDSYTQLYIIQPILNAALLLSIWLIFKGDRKALCLFALSFIGQLILMVVSAGRGSLLIVAKALVFALFCFSEKGEIARTIKKLLTPGRAVLCVACVVFLLGITSSRSNEDSTLFETMYQYYFTGPVFLTALLEQENPFWSVNQTFMFGWATFGFLINVPLTIGLLLGLDTKTSVYWIASYLTSKNLQIGDGLFSNAMCTCFYDFLMDWGYAGAVIGPLLIVGFSYLVITKTKSRPDDPFIGSLSLYWLILLFGTTFRWEAVDITPTCVVFFLWLFARRIKPQMHDKKSSEASQVNRKQADAFMKRSNNIEGIFK